MKDTKGIGLSRLGRRWLLAAVLLVSATGYIYAHRHTGFIRIRYFDLPAFDPHRKDFICVHQATAPLDPEANQWFEQGMVLVSEDKEEDERDYKAAIALWSKAAQRKHWKAQESLAMSYLHGEGVESDREKAFELIQEAMARGEPKAWELMGKLQGFRDRELHADRMGSYAFTQRAADLGDPEALTYIGENLLFPLDNNEAGVWNNRKVGLQMLECALAQGHGAAARRLGLEYERKNTTEDIRRALTYFQAGVKAGNKDSADALRDTFRVGPVPDILAPFSDRYRERRYVVFSQALYDFPWLRFPNLDKILPLPPAKLPDWDGNRDHLLMAAMAPGITPPQAVPVLEGGAVEVVEEDPRLVEARNGLQLLLNKTMNDALKRLDREKTHP
ncbi:sel1 repeat family protein [Oxalobacteraceae bacterium]|nr:sel1 repeat family protein [Oxalobacteraceae bacterium]